MADSKVTGLGELIGPPADSDMIYLADVSDTSMAASGTSKKNQGKNYLRTNGTANTLGANIAANGYNFTGAGTITTTGLTAGTPTFSSFANAQHNHSTAANGGQVTTDAMSDYAAGTWTPAITFGGGNTGLTYSSRDGRYVRIGKIVYISCEIRLSAKGSSTGGAKITNLPYTAATTAAGGVPSIIWYQMASNLVYVAGAVDTGGTSITLVVYGAAATGYGVLTNAEFANNSIIQLTVVYEAA